MATNFGTKTATKWQVGLGHGHTALDEDPANLSKRRTTPPQFSAHVYHGKMAGWIKMQYGRKIGLDPSYIVLDEDPAPPPQKWAEPPPNFRPMSIVAKEIDGSICHLV